MSELKTLTLKNTNFEIPEYTAGDNVSISSSHKISVDMDGVAEQARELYGSPFVASTASAMTDTSRVYVYTGSESGYTSGHWYYYNGSAWTDGGVYNSEGINTDTTLTLAGVAADAEATGDAIAELKSDLNTILPSAINSVDESSNLLRINPEYFKQETNGVILTRRNDGLIYVNGTATAHVQIPVTGENKKVLSFPAGTYTFSFTSMSGFNSTNRLYVRYAYDISGAATNIIQQTTSARTATITFEQNAYVFLWLSSGGVYDNAWFYLQIEEGTNTSPTFEQPAMMADYESRNILDGLSWITTPNDAIYKTSFDVGVKYPKSFDVEDLLDDISTYTATNTTGKVKVSNLRYQRHTNAYLITNNGSSSPAYIDYRLANPISFYGIQEIDIAFYISSNASNIDRIRLRAMNAGYDAYRNVSWTDGWNYLRIGLNGTGMGESVTESRIMIYIYYNDSTVVTPVYVCAVQTVRPPHASIIFVEDAGYGSFYDIAYPLLKTAECPVTWAIECSHIYEQRDSSSRPLISLTELTNLEDDGISEFSWHGYGGEKTTSMDARETADYNLKCIRYLARRGDLNGKIFRAVWPGNDAPNYELAIQDLDASATYNGTADNAVYPYYNKYNIPRYSLQTRDTTWMDDFFTRLEMTHQIAYVYTHGIIDSSEFDPNGQDMRLDMLQYFITKMQTGITAGWLKTTTFNRLEREYAD